MNYNTDLSLWVPLSGYVQIVAGCVRHSTKELTNRGWMAAFSTTGDAVETLTKAGWNLCDRSEDGNAAVMKKA